MVKLDDTVFIRGIMKLCFVSSKEQQEQVRKYDLVRTLCGSNTIWRQAYVLLCFRDAKDKVVPARRAYSEMWSTYSVDFTWPERLKWPTCW